MLVVSWIRTYYLLVSQRWLSHLDYSLRLLRTDNATIYMASNVCNGSETHLPRYRFYVGFTEI